MPKRNLIWIGAVVAAAVVTAWVTHKPPPVGAPGRGSVTPTVRAHRLIKESYYQPLADETLYRGAVRGMVEQLDEFSSYVPPERLTEFSHRMMGLERSLGLRVEIADGAVTVIGPLPGSPAHRAALAAGDRILTIDGEDLDGLALDEVRQLLAGEIDTPVELAVVRSGAEQKETIKLFRREFAIETVTGLFRDCAGRWVYMIDSKNRIAYVRSKEFVRETGGNFQRVFRKLGGLSGLILDLRDNPGGGLTAAVEAADMFLNNGVIVTKLTRQSAPQVYKAHDAGTIPDVPMVLLINSRTASAAEIVAGALRFHDRAVLVGARTRGKGCVQTMFPLRDGLGQINLTTSEFRFEQDRRITRRPGSDTWGIEPHEQVTIDPKRQTELERLRLRTEVMPLRRDTYPAVDGPARRRRTLAKMLKLDPQLARAARLLKSPDKMRSILARAAERRAKRQRLLKQRKAGPRDE